jgi:Zn finger protein HypA/HybF involved in hydrogenase expression
LHELSIASQIWASVARAAAEHGARRVKAIKLELGALNLIVEDQLTFWLQELAAREGSPGVEVTITTLPEVMQIRVVSAEIEPGERQG